MNIDMKKCVSYVGGEPVVTFEKGDVAGHEFHGNQYTDLPSGDSPKFLDSVKERARLGARLSGYNLPSETIVRRMQQRHDALLENERKYPKQQAVAFEHIAEHGYGS